MRVSLCGLGCWTLVSDARSLPTAPVPVASAAGGTRILCETAVLGHRFLMICKETLFILQGNDHFYHFKLID